MNGVELHTMGTWQFMHKLRITYTIWLKLGKAWRFFILFVVAKINGKLQSLGVWRANWYSNLRWSVRVISIAIGTVLQISQLIITDSFVHSVYFSYIGRCIVVFFILCTTVTGFFPQHIPAWTCLPVHTSLCTGFIFLSKYSSFLLPFLYMCWHE